MARVTRRAFISTAGAVAGAAALTAAGPNVASAVAAITEQPLQGSEATSSVVAYVKNPASGQISLLAGEREVTVTDRALVKRIVSASR
jgi:hypothetical protein